jgi:MFS family permease
MAGATIAPSLPGMEKHFSELGVANAELLVRLVLTFPALFIVIGSPIAGIIIDKFGRKPLLAASALLYGLSGSSGSYLESIELILVGRALLGLAVAGIMTSATTLITDYFTGQARASFIGLQAAFMGFGGVLFLSLGGRLADLNWHAPFLIYLFALLLFMPIIFYLYEPDRSQRSAPKSAQTETGSTPTILLVTILATAIASQLIFYLIPTQLPFYLKSLLQATASQSGLAIAFGMLFSAFASISYGWIKSRLHFVQITILVCGLMGAGYCIIGNASSYPIVLLGLAILGLGLGLVMPNLTVWLSSVVPDRQRGRALGWLSSCLFLGQFLSPIVSQPLARSIGLNHTYTSAGIFLLVASIGFSLSTRYIIRLGQQQT